MVQSCCAYNCTERAKGNSSYAFHRFPLNNEGLLRAWCIAIRRKDFHPQKHSRICSKHFTADSYKAGFRFRKLRRDAIPTVFDFGDSKRSQRKSKAKKLAAAAASYKRFISSKGADGYFRDDEKIGNVSNTSENEYDQEERVVEVIKLNNYQNNEQTGEYDTDDEIAKDCNKNYAEDPKSSFSETILKNDNVDQLHDVASNLSDQKQMENVKLRQTILLMHKRIEKFMFLIDCLQSTDMISEEAAFVLRSTMDM